MNAQTSLINEIFVDNFAGGGGASTGIELATGMPVTIAINHDPDAIAMHMANHPYTEHYQASVWDIDPVEVCKGRPVGLAWFSPDCKHFSRAKGAKPVDKNIRGLAWIALRWAGTVRPRVIILENVPEFVTWGPVRRGKPVKSRQGQTFNKFVSQLEELGYEVQYRKLKACDYGAPTIRERFFLVARCDGKPIVFPKPTHGKRAENARARLKPYRTAAECIDWSLPCKSIFGRKKPLAENTMKRIARGLDKFTIKSGKPFIVTCNHGGDIFRGQGLSAPLNTITQKCTDGIVEPFIVNYKFNNEPESKDAPLSTVTSVNSHYVCAPHISKYYGGIVGSEADKPLPTVTSWDHNALAAASLIQYHSEQSNSEVRGQALDKPIMTVDGSPRYALTAAHIVKYYSGADQASAADAPLPTITTKDRNALAESHLCILRRGEDGRSLEDPLPTITTSGAHFAEVRTTVVKYDDKATDLGNWPEVRKLLNEHCGYDLKDDEVLLLRIEKDWYYIRDIGMRMLAPRELYAAQGFPPDYIIDRDVNGKKYNRTKQVARCGNAVPPPFAEALVRANLPEYCGDKITTMHDLKERQAV